MHWYAPATMRPGQLVEATVPHSFRHDLALERYARAGARWLEERQHGHDTHADLDRLRRAFRREEKRDRKQAKR